MKSKGTKMRNPIGLGKRPKTMKLSLVYLIYNFNTTSEVISKQFKFGSSDFGNQRQWNSCSPSYNLTILTKLSPFHKKKNTQTMFMAMMPFCFHSALYFFSFLAKVILAQLQIYGNIKRYLRIPYRPYKCYSQLIWKLTIYFFVGSKIFTLAMRTVIE